MNLDPSLAHTAIIELFPRMSEDQAAPLRRELAAAMTEANPPDRWAFARTWLAERVLADNDAKGAPYGLPWPSVTIDLAMAQAIARSAHPSRVLANTRVYRYGRFTETPWCAVCGSAKLARSHTERPNHNWTPAIDVTMMGNRIATFHANGVTLYSCGRQTVTTSTALSELVSGGYFYHDAGVLVFSAYESTGSQRTGTPAREGEFYPYKRKAA